MKLHTLLDLRGQIPTPLRIVPAHIHDVHILDQLTPEPGAFYVMDRGSLDFACLYRWTQHGAFTRARKDFRFKRLVSHPIDTTTGVQGDQTIRLVSFYSVKGHPDRLRRIRCGERTRHQRLVFPTNNFALPAVAIADLYRCRTRNRAPRNSVRAGPSWRAQNMSAARRSLQVKSGYSNRCRTSRTISGSCGPNHRSAS